MTNIKNTVQKGFTLIELLVVIAIIGILAGILFIAIDPAAQTRKADDANVKTALSQIRTQATIDYIDDIDGYTTLCDETLAGKSYALYDSAVKAGKGDVGVCESGEGFYVSAVLLNNPTDDSKAFCVDLNGFAGEIDKSVMDSVTEECK